jgi:hypothetical protein
MAGLHYVGSVAMIVSLSDTGYVCDVTIVKELDPEADKDALAAIHNEVFQPIRVDDKPSPGSMMIFRDFWRDDAHTVLAGQNAGAAPDETPEPTNADVPDIVSVLAASKIDGDTYTNRYFGVSFTAPGAQLSANPVADPGGDVVRLVDAFAPSQNRSQMFSIGLVAARLAGAPQLKSQSAYIDALVAKLGARGDTQTHGDFPFIISGVQFMGAILKEPEGPKASAYHFRGLFVTPRNGYLLLIDITAATEQQILKLAGSVQLKPDHT